MKYFILGFIIIFVLHSCKDMQTLPEKKPEQKPEQKKDTFVSVPDTVPKSMNVFKGMVVINKNTTSFRDCASPDSTYWISDKTNKLEGLYKKIYPEPNVYNSVIAEVKGELVPTDEHKLTDKYPQTLVVKEIVSVVNKRSDNICVPFDYWAYGTDSDWSLEISKEENLIELELKPEKKTYYFFYSDPIEEPGITYYRNYNAIQRYTIEVKIKNEQCTDPKTGKAYDYSFEVNLSGNRKFKGCGIKGKVQ